MNLKKKLQTKLKHYEKKTITNQKIFSTKLSNRTNKISIDIDYDSISLIFAKIRRLLFAFN